MVRRGPVLAYSRGGNAAASRQTLSNYKNKILMALGATILYTAFLYQSGELCGALLFCLCTLALLMNSSIHKSHFVCHCCSSLSLSTGGARSFLGMSKMTSDRVLRIATWNVAAINNVSDNRWPLPTIASIHDYDGDWIQCMHTQLVNFPSSSVSRTDVN